MEQLADDAGVDMRMNLEADAVPKEEVKEPKHALLAILKSSDRARKLLAWETRCSRLTLREAASRPRPCARSDAK
jgi:hypothetical protein